MRTPHGVRNSVRRTRMRTPHGKKSTKIVPKSFNFLAPPVFEKVQKPYGF
jgi:hypothetical protein